MAFVLADRVQETSTSPGGTGTLTLAGSAVPGFKTFSAGIGTGNTFYYTIYDPGSDRLDFLIAGSKPQQRARGFA